MSALSDQAKAELVRVQAQHGAERLAELAGMIRFGGELSVEQHRLVVIFRSELQVVAQRFALEVQHIVGSLPHIAETPAPKRGYLYEVRVERGAKELIRRTGMVSPGGHQIIGLPLQVVSGTVEVAEAAWRGAFLAAGSLSDPNRSSSLDVAAPGQEAALALVGCARRMGVAAKTRESRGVEKVSVRDGEAVGAMLSRMGAHTARLLWDQKRVQREAKPSANRLANFDDANLRRSARAAMHAAARVEEAMAILGDDIPDHLAQAGQLRLEHRHASLEELGRLSDPQMTKDAIAGRIRRLLHMADKRAEELGIPDTSARVKGMEKQDESS
ncbi:DNA-binding protein WhiA [Corynebacterium pelargi]|uniref:Probable cell division protein WhiA n=1 Tax=Corynebacterium pelargi TaxID=1471400 RepID=A0A410W8N8_9CORY|nr:DNA-binding protein WhiA [Corynebacterium pelargi]QAU52323.1 Putative sporulation transcription regulator WhiA [Corynebacterium pelargi]GGG68489.1 putative sporulation transcription regulator WhiA [Corynebacterium pelargi]